MRKSICGNLPAMQLNTSGHAAGYEYATTAQCPLDAEAKAACGRSFAFRNKGSGNLSALPCGIQVESAFAHDARVPRIFRPFLTGRSGDGVLLAHVPQELSGAAVHHERTKKKKKKKPVRLARRFITRLICALWPKQSPFIHARPLRTSPFRRRSPSKNTHGRLSGTPNPQVYCPTAEGQETARMSWPPIRPSIVRARYLRLVNGVYSRIAHFILLL